MNAFKLSLILPVGSGNMTTMRTFLRRVPGINICHRTAMSFRFVYEKLLQLKKTPVMELSFLSLSMPTSLTNIFEILKYNRRSNRNRLNYFFRYTMVLVPTKTVLLLRYALKVSFRGSGATRLEPSSESLISMRNSSDSSSTEKQLITGDSNSSNASVDSDKDIRAIAEFRIWNEFFKTKCKEYSSFIINQFRRLSFPSSELVKIIIGCEFNALDSSRNGEDGNFIFIKPYIIGVLI